MENKTPFLIILALSFVFSLAAIPGDLQFIKENQNIYLYGRFTWGFVSLILLLLTYLNKYSVKKLVIPYLILMMLYSFHGQYFLPGYYLGFAEIILVIGLFFPVEKQLFRIITILSCIIMCWFVLESPATYNSLNSEIDQKFRIDAIIAVILITIGSLLGHTFITLKRQEKDEAYRKFLDIGKYSSFLFHDFKGLLTTPIFYADMLQQTLRSGQNSDEIVEKLNEDLTFLQEYAKEIMKLTLPDSDAYQQEEVLDIQKIEKTLNVLLRKPLHKIELEIINNGIPAKQINSFKLIKVLYNATMNSAEYFKHNSQILKPKITIEFSTKAIIVSDNGSGFPEYILNKLNQEEVMVSTKDGGSGIGTAIIKDIVKNMDGKVEFFNKNGAIVHISFN